MGLGMVTILFRVLYLINIGTMITLTIMKIKRKGQTKRKLNLGFAAGRKKC